MTDADLPDDATTLAHRAADQPPAESYRLLVAEGPDAGKSFLVTAADPARLLVGKSAACDIRLVDRAVSRRHAAVQVLAGRLHLTDLGATNGTWVGAIRVFSAELRGGEVVKMGTTTFRVEREAPVASLSPSQATAFGTTMGASPAMRRLYPLCERLALSDVAVVIEGETGTGKEQLAESLHAEGPRRDGPFVVFDCTAVAPTLIEAELFGYERGAFTGATHARAGFFEEAHGGTLLVDEIGDLPLELQPKLLRAIERRQIVRVGGRTPQQLDVRVLAATRRDLDREVQVGRFREDLFHRIAVARIELPPLRERQGDVSLLAREFWRELGETADVPHELLMRWEDWRWPGNVRELKNAVARRIALGDLAVDAGPSSTRPPEGPSDRLPGRDPVAGILALDLPLAEARHKLLVEFERRYAEHVLSQHGGNVTRAAAAAGVARRHFYRLKGR